MLARLQRARLPAIVPALYPHTNASMPAAYVTLSQHTSAYGSTRHLTSDTSKKKEEMLACQVGVPLLTGILCEDAHVPFALGLEMDAALNQHML